MFYYIIMFRYFNTLFTLRQNNEILMYNETNAFFRSASLVRSKLCVINQHDFLFRHLDGASLIILILYLYSLYFLRFGS